MKQWRASRQTSARSSFSRGITISATTTWRACSIARPPRLACARIARSPSSETSIENWSGSMQCEQARETIVDNLVERRAAPARARRSSRRVRGMPIVPRRLPSVVDWAGGASRARAVARCTCANRRPARSFANRGWSPRGASGQLVAAGWIIAALVGYGIASRPAKVDETPRYLLLLYDSPLPPGAQPPADTVVAALIAEYSAWAQRSPRAGTAGERGKAHRRRRPVVRWRRGRGDRRSRRRLLRDPREDTSRSACDRRELSRISSTTVASSSARSTRRENPLALRI